MNDYPVRGRPAFTLVHRTLWTSVPTEPMPAATIAGLLGIDAHELCKRLEHMALTGRIERAESGKSRNGRWLYFRRAGETYEQCEAAAKARQAATRAANIRRGNERMSKPVTIDASTRTEWRQVDGQRVKVTVYVPPAAKTTTTVLRIDSADARPWARVVAP